MSRVADKKLYDLLGVKPNTPDTEIRKVRVYPRTANTLTQSRPR